MAGSEAAVAGPHTSIIPAEPVLWMEHLEAKLRCAAVELFVLQLPAGVRDSSPPALLE